MFPTVNIGPLVIPTAGLVYIIGAWIALSIVERSAKILKLNAEAIYGVAVTGFAAGFIGARLVFAALHWTAYRENIIGIIWPLTSGYDFWAGLIIGGLAAFFYGRYKQLPLASTLDALWPGILVALLTVSLADFLSGPGYGTETSLPWGINVFGIQRHPVQLYEIAITILAFITWRGYVTKRTFDGQLFLMSLAAYSGGRLLFDAFRANAWLTSSGYHSLQIMSLIVLLVSLFLLGRQLTKDPESSPEVD